MIAVAINGLTVALGGLIGIFLKRFISQKHITSIFSIMGVLTIIMGLQGVIPSEHMMVILVSLFLGSILGVALDLSGKLEAFSKRFDQGSGQSSFVSGAFTIFLIQCMGAMAILGPLNAGLEGDNNLLYFKAVLDMGSSIIFASMYGKSIFLSALLLFLYQGSIYLLARLAGPILDVTVIEQLTQVGSVILVALGIEILELKKMNIVNYLPALLIPIVYFLIRILIL
ncbi:MAG: DUF554 domain-containing protein [Tissierellia bacterium]|nr:DUF554 domain-containing protein [Tissierellia bacterium]